MSNISIKSEKSDSNQSGGSSSLLAANNSSAKNIMEGMVPYHHYQKAKLHELFAMIEKEFDALYDENQECM